MIKSSALIGYTGFVGGNILNQNKFDFLYNRKNIKEIYGKEFDLVVVAAAPGAKWLANQNPENDLASITILIKSLSCIKAKKIVLISTIDVYPLANNVNEDSIIDKNELKPYGKHRRILEEFAISSFDALIIRLPALFGSGLKKNIIYDYLHDIHTPIPKDNVFQFYNLNNIWKDAEIALKSNLPVVNFATEPISFKELKKEIFGQDFFPNDYSKATQYDMKTKYGNFWQKTGVYLYTKQDILAELKSFIKLLS